MEHISLRTPVCRYQSVLVLAVYSAPASERSLIITFSLRSYKVSSLTDVNNSIWTLSLSNSFTLLLHTFPFPTIIFAFLTCLYCCFCVSDLLSINY